MVWWNLLFGATSWNTMRMWISNVYEEQLAVIITVGSGYSDMRVWHYWSSLSLQGCFLSRNAYFFFYFQKRGKTLEHIAPLTFTYLFTEDKVKKCKCIILNAFINIKKSTITSHIPYTISNSIYTIYQKRKRTIHIYQTTQHIHVFTKYNFASDSWTKKMSKYRLSKSLYLLIYSIVYSYTHTHTHIRFLNLLPERDPYRNNTWHDVKWPDVSRSDPESVMSHFR